MPNRFGSQRYGHSTEISRAGWSTLGTVRVGASPGFETAAAVDVSALLA
jgi:hypothetical protein